MYSIYCLFPSPFHSFIYMVKKRKRERETERRKRERKREENERKNERKKMKNERNKTQSNYPIVLPGSF